MTCIRIAATLVGLVMALVASSAHAGHVAGAQAAQDVYGRLLAPCCWNQTLDIHDSELATRLRVEIAARLQRGEGTTAIEDDLARRFGDRIRAVPRGADPRQTMALWVSLALTIALLSLCLLGLRWTRRRAALIRQGEEMMEPELQAELDARLDQELRRAESPVR